MRARLVLARYGASLTELLPGAEARLDDFERAHLARIQNPRRRAQFLRGRELLGYLLKDENAAVGIDGDGRPEIHSSSRLHASIAHSGDALAAVVAGQPVGVDIEPVRRWADPAAVATLLSAGSGELGPLQTWVAGEARLKAGGAVCRAVWRTCWNECEVALAGVEDPPLTIVFDLASATYNPLVLQWQAVHLNDRMHVVDSDHGR